MRQLTEEEVSGRIYRAEDDTNAVVLFVQAKRVDPTKPRCILDIRDRNEAVDPNHTPLPSIEELMELVAARKYWSKIDLADGNTISESKKIRNNTPPSSHIWDIIAVALCNKATTTLLLLWYELCTKFLRTWSSRTLSSISTILLSCPIPMTNM